jgi:hypothetical protein
MSMGLEGFDDLLWDQQGYTLPINGASQQEEVSSIGSIGLF